MGLFDMFKKKDESPKAESVTANNEIAKAKEITVKFASKMPIPFKDPVYSSLFINYTGEAVLSSKDPAIDIEPMSAVIAANIAATAGLALSRCSFCYKEYAAQNVGLAKEVAAALTDYNLKSFKLLSFEPDEMSKGMIDRIDSMKQLL
jgi:hypothetical protein